MIRDTEDDDVWRLEKDDELSLEFTFGQSIRMDGFLFVLW